MDPSEFLWSIRDQTRFNTDFRSSPGASVAYHAPCHLRAQAVGFKGRDLLRRIPGVAPRAVMECCGHNGTYAMKADGFEESQRIGQKAFEGMRQVGAETWVTDCPPGGPAVRAACRQEALAPMSVLARAYREGGFPTLAPKKGEGQP